MVFASQIGFSASIWFILISSIKKIHLSKYLNQLSKSGKTRPNYLCGLYIENFCILGGKILWAYRLRVGCLRAKYKHCEIENPKI
jgi:hypothetical protein